MKDFLIFIGEPIFVVLIFGSLLYTLGGVQEQFFWECSEDQDYNWNWQQCYNSDTVESEVKYLLRTENGTASITDLQHSTGLMSDIILRVGSDSDGFDCYDYLATKRCSLKTGGTE